MSTAHAGRDTRHANGAMSDSVGLTFYFVNAIALNSLTNDTKRIRSCSPRRAVTVINGNASSLRSHVDDHLTVPSNG